MESGAAVSCLVFPLVYDAVRQILLVEDGGTMGISFGWREPTKQSNQGVGTARRIVFVPGDGEKLGGYRAAQKPGRNPTPLATLDEVFAIYVWGYDTLAPNDEVAQYTAARLLHDATVRAIIKACTRVGTSFTLSDPKWIRTKTERVHGAELKFLLTLDAMIPDETLQEVTTGGAIGSYLNDTLDGTDTYPGATP